MFHGGEVLHAENSLVGKITTKLAAWKGARLVANSNYSANLVKKHTGRDCRGIPLGVSRYWLEPAKDAFSNAQLAALSSDTQLICLVGRLERRKGHLIAIEIAQRLQKHPQKNWRLVIAGRVEDAAYAQAVQSQCDANPNCMYAGQLSRDDIRRLYARSTALLLPAQQEPNHIEGFGLVILEAAAQGCPTVTTRVGGIPDALIPDSTGYLFDQHDVDGMTAAVSALLYDNALTLRMGEAAKEFAASCTWDDVCERTFAD